MTVTPPRILNLEPADYSRRARAMLDSIGSVVDGPFSRAELLQRVSDFDVMIVRLGHVIDREVILAGRRLRAVVSATTGLDHIDVPAARERGIEVLSLRGETEFLRTISATAEHTWALLLSLRRQVPAARASVVGGSWDRMPFRGRELKSARIGLLGFGRVALQVAAYARAFDMQIVAYDPYALNWQAGVERCRSLSELLSTVEILSVHVPLTDETRCLIQADRLGELPAGAILINTSRGEIVDENALVDALESGRLAGAALDTIWHERDPAKRNAGRLLEYARTHDNLIVTPHIGGATLESMAMTELFMAEKLSAFLKGGAPNSSAAASPHIERSNVV
jgi:D-3-phosphoglycerate dehydrogenase / 2-oxoglutarate reductase